MKFIVPLIATSQLLGCLSAAKLSRLIESRYVGKSQTEIEGEWGKPDLVHEKPEGGKLLVYMKPEVPPTMVIKGGDSVYTMPAENFKRNACRFTFTIDSASKVQSVFWDGSRTLCKRQSDINIIRPIE